MGILNITPDSFSGDGMSGKSAEAILAHAQAMADDGASVIDIGAESTRPGATPLSASEEWVRIAPFAKLISTRKHLRFSIDSYHPENAKRAIKAGFAWVNDVNGGRNPAMLEAVAASNAMIVLMHSLGVPAAKNIVLEGDPVAAVLAWGYEALAACEKAGIARSRIILDPGIGFGKTAEQSLLLLRNIAAFKAWGVRLLVGHSRKSFLTPLIGAADERDQATLAVSSYLALNKVDYLRVHAIAPHAQLLTVIKALV